MPIPPKLTVHLSAVTPLFIGGAEPNRCIQPQGARDPHDHAELRPPSIKGLLRYWYRALDGNYRAHESRFFGSTDTGQAACLLSVKPWVMDNWAWPRKSYGSYRRGNKLDDPNGINYLGYSLELGANHRAAIQQGQKFCIMLQPRPGENSAEVRRAWLGALWLLVHAGGIGSRSRRGLGSLRIDRWRAEGFRAREGDTAAHWETVSEGEGWPEMGELQLPCQAPDIATWETRMKHDLQVLRTWFPTSPRPEHTVLAAGTRFLLLNVGCDKWEQALDEAGYLLQHFRQRYDQAIASDYVNVRDHLAKGAGITVSGVRPSQMSYLTDGPERTGFGLPLSFRFNGLGGRSITFQGDEHDRMASPLFIRVVQIGRSYHGAFIHPGGPGTLPRGEQLNVPPNQRPTTSGPGAGPWSWSPAASTIVSRFLNTEVKPNAVEVTTP